MAVGFKLVSDPGITEYRVFRVASQAYTLGDACHQDRTSDAVDIVPATASSTTVNIYAVAMETVTSAATTLLACIVESRQRWSADVTNTAATNHSYQRMILTDKATVNNTGTDDTSVNAVFEQVGVISTTGKRIVGRFLAVPNVTA